MEQQVIQWGTYFIHLKKDKKNNSNYNIMVYVYENNNLVFGFTAKSFDLKPIIEQLEISIKNRIEAENELLKAFV